MGTNGNQKSSGKRARTRDLFAQAFRTKGVPNLSRHLKIYRVGDIVDIKADPSIQSGMPYKCYHGKTGRIWNITPRAVGIYLNKMVGHRYVLKKLHIRTEHVQHSTSRDDFLARVKRNDASKAAAKAAGRACPPLRTVHVLGSKARVCAPATWRSYG
jgi:large subunit ribosomal protein L21e